MGDILSKLKMVSEKVGVTETAHTIEEQIDLISESLDKVPTSTNIAEALDDLSEVAQNINGGGESAEVVEINMTMHGSGFTSSVSFNDAMDAVLAGKKLKFIILNDGNEIVTSIYSAHLSEDNRPAFIILAPEPYAFVISGNEYLVFLWDTSYMELKTFNYPVLRTTGGK